MNEAIIKAFSKFCDDDPFLYALSEPWTHGGYLYATNGRFAVRTKCEAEYPGVDGKKPPADHLFGHVDFSDCDNAWPEHDGTTVPDMGDCPWCDGEGWVEDIDCSKCKGGEFPVARKTHVRVGGVLIDGRYATTIELLGNVKWKPNKSVEERDSLAFTTKIDGHVIEGIVMSICTKEGKVAV